jgi:aspartyl-tRNA(Asn)/glutamyl-tRNA(Gln) amidotransferase subunit A
VLVGSPHRTLTPGDPRRVRLGIPRDYFLSLLDSHVSAAFEDTCQQLREDGISLEEVAIPHAGDVAAIYLHIVLAEGVAYHAKSLERQPDDYTPNVRFRLETGRYVLAEDYVRALHGRDLLRREVDEALAGLDGLFLPTLPIVAPKLGVNTVRVGMTEEPVRSLMLRCTQAFNVSGHSAITIPCRRARNELPIGAQIVGRRGETHSLLRVARTVEHCLGQA